MELGWSGITSTGKPCGPPGQGWTRGDGSSSSRFSFPCVCVGGGRLQGEPTLDFGRMGIMGKMLRVRSLGRKRQENTPSSDFSWMLCFQIFAYSAYLLHTDY